MEEQTQTEWSAKKWVIPASIIVAAVLIAGAIFYSTGLKKDNSDVQNQDAAQNATTTENNNSNGKTDSKNAVLGNPDAKVSIVAFGDFQCPFCAKFFKEIELPLRKNYIDTGKVKFEFKPLAFLDSQAPVKESQNSVMAVQCARDQGKFWEFQDAIYEIEYKEMEKMVAGQIASSENNGNLTADLFKKIAANLKMNINDFAACYDSGKYKNAYNDNMKEATALMPQGVGTPAIFINGRQTQLTMNAQRNFDFAAFSNILDELLK